MYATIALIIAIQNVMNAEITGATVKLNTIMEMRSVRIVIEKQSKMKVKARMNNMCKTFTEICKMTQSEVKKYTAKQLKKTHENVTVGDGFVYAKGNFPVLLVAHMDTVHKALPRTIMYFKDTDILTCNEGIGGDDRCGIYIILEIVKRYNCSVLFCEDEEIGGVGAKKFIKTEIAKTVDPNYIIEFDRKGKNDAVFYDCGNQEFELFITERFFKTNWGTFSDISILAPFIGVAAVNLSC